MLQHQHQHPPENEISVHMLNSNKQEKVNFLKFGGTELCLIDIKLRLQVYFTTCSFGLTVLSSCQGACKKVYLCHVWQILKYDYLQYNTLGQ